MTDSSPLRITFEMVLEEPDGVIVARDCGVDRIELCANLAEGGTTPTLGTVEEVISMAEGTVALACMLRPRGGEFVYTDAEFRSMLSDARHLADMAARSGVAMTLVTGILTPDGHIDRPRTAAVLDAAGGLPVAVHHAFDETVDLDESLDALIDLGVVRVLTSGGRRRLRDGESALARLVERSGGRLEIMSGGEIDTADYPALLRRTGIRDVHFGAHATRPSLSGWSNPEMTYDYGERSVADADRVRAYLSAMRG